ADGDLRGSVGGGVMEVKLVERSREMLAEPPATGGSSILIDQVHRQNAHDASGMICSGKQTVILKKLTTDDREQAGFIADTLVSRSHIILSMENDRFGAGPPISPTENRRFYRFRSDKFSYSELLGPSHDLYI